MSDLKQVFLAVLLAASVLCSGGLHAQVDSVSGVVFVDTNANGVRDSGERGVANVAVSNQDAVVTTDASGAYRVARGITGVVFVSVPDGYRATSPFWRPANSAGPVDFGVQPTARAGDFTFIHASDTHVAPAVLPRLQRFRAMADALNPAFVLITGDLVRDALRVGETEAAGYYDLFDQEAALFKSPVWTIPGNHENFGIEQDKSKVPASHPLFGRGMYRQHRGPDYYSFTYGGVHFVGLNTVDIDGPWYYGHVDETQLAWLERDLALVPSAMPVVTFNHIPFFTTVEMMGGYTEAPPAPTLITVNGKTIFRHVVSNAAAVLKVLRTRRHTLALAGHIHAGEHITYEVDGLKTAFNQSAAIVGAGSGAGMPFVSGFTVYTVHDGAIDAGRFVPLGLDVRR